LKIRKKRKEKNRGARKKKMKIPKGSIDNEHRVPDTPNVSGKVAQPEPKAKVAQTESAAQSQGRI